jgi:hypothetical protein
VANDGHMEEDEERSPATEKGMVAPPTEASLRLQVIDLLLGGLRDARVDWLTLEQSRVLQRIESELETYGGYFYPPDHC